MQRSRKLHELPLDEQRILIEESAGKRRRISNTFRFDDNDGGMPGSCPVTQDAPVDIPFSQDLLDALIDDAKSPFNMLVLFPDDEFKARLRRNGDTIVDLDADTIIVNPLTPLPDGPVADYIRYLMGAA
jgi:hypothetical protein